MGNIISYTSEIDSVENTEISSESPIDLVEETNQESTKVLKKDDNSKLLSQGQVIHLLTEKFKEIDEFIHHSYPEQVQTDWDPEWEDWEDIECKEYINNKGYSRLVDKRGSGKTKNVIFYLDEKMLLLNESNENPNNIDGNKF